MSYIFDINTYENNIMKLNENISFNEVALCILKAYNVEYYNTRDLLNAMLKDKKTYHELSNHFELASLYLLYLTLKEKNLGDENHYTKLQQSIKDVWNKIK